MYTEKVMDHFENPRNVGESTTANAVGEMESASCGDTTIIYLDIEDNIIKDIHFKTYGCAAAIASSSMLTEMVKGKTLEEAEAITTDSIVQELGGLPPAKIHCSVLAGDALKRAIANYRAEHKA
ncbi:Iron-sulfur cluster assembly scaffold protein IscU [bioreactor metagenome]|uniref:Iron-sulfur cluster assembly scaffold protein IscU n=1 Tax=bioreactor metagenome TaxID=1076179 RepID=A0A645J0L1_9ZZZZ